MFLQINFSTTKARLSFDILALMSVLPVAFTILPKYVKYWIFFTSVPEKVIGVSCCGLILMVLVFLVLIFNPTNLDHLILACTSLWVWDSKLMSSATPFAMQVPNFLVQIENATVFQSV